MDKSINLSSSRNSVQSKGALSIPISLSENSLRSFWPCTNWSFVPLCSVYWLRKSIAGCCRRSYTNKNNRAYHYCYLHTNRLFRHRNVHYKKPLSCTTGVFNTCHADLKRDPKILHLANIEICENHLSRAQSDLDEKLTQSRCQVMDATGWSTSWTTK